MLHNYPGIQHRGDLQGKLILPDPEKIRRSSLQGPSAYRDAMPPVRVVDAMPAAPSSFVPIKKWRDLSGTDPAYAFLTIALLVTLIACLLFFASIGSIFAHFEWPPSIPRVVAAKPHTFVMTAHTILSTPSPGPEGKPTKKYQPTAEGILLLPSPTPDVFSAGAVPLNLTIVSIPAQVENNSIVTVRVTTSQPGVQVRLLVTYQTLTAVYTSGSQFTDAKGNATLFWRVLIVDPSHKPILAHVKVITRNTDGTLTSSQKVAVQINP